MTQMGSASTPATVPRPRDPGAEDRRAQADADEAGGAIVVAVSSDPRRREELVRRLDGAAVVILAPNLEAARTVLGQLGSSPMPALDTAPGPLGLLIDERRQQVTWQGEKIPLTHHEHKLLALMAGDVGRVWTHEHLHLAVWKTRFLTNASGLHSSVKRLRRKLEASGVPLRIEAVRGVGFQLSQRQDQAARPPLA